MGDMTGTGDAKFANTPNSGDKRKARSKSRAKLPKKSKKDGGDGPLSGKGNWKGTGHGDTSRSMSRVARDKSGVRDPETRQKLDTMKKKMQQKKFGLWGKAGESDRQITTKMPKHLFAGKRGAGKTEHR